tara:strand:- start:3339 stop:3734 length:396 start_codon:yes stop_codon:yes gene_type:complete
MSLLDFITNQSFEKTPYTSGNVFGFIFTHCGYSKAACKLLRENNINSELYDVNKKQFVNNTDPLQLNGQTNDTYLEAYINMKTNKKCGDWSYPHLFFFNDGWKYIGGSSDLKSDLEKSNSSDLQQNRYLKF